MTLKQNKKQNRNIKQTEIERFDWFIEWIQTRMAFGWNAPAKKLAREHSRNRFDVILQHDWPTDRTMPSPY